MLLTYSFVGLGKMSVLRVATIKKFAVGDTQSAALSSTFPRKINKKTSSPKKV